MLRARTVAVEFDEAAAFVALIAKVRGFRALDKDFAGKGTKPPTVMSLNAVERLAKDRQSMATRLDVEPDGGSGLVVTIAKGTDEGQGGTTIVIDRAGKPAIAGGEPHRAVSDRKFRKALDDVVSPRGNRYGHIKRIEIDGIVFHSPIEGKRYEMLRDMRDAGEIVDLTLQEPYRFEEAGRHCFTYLADFQYVVVASGQTVVEDVKGMPTDVYKLKKKLIEARFGIRIVEWPTPKKEIERLAREAARAKAAAEKAERARVREERRAQRLLEEEARRQRREARTASEGKTG